MKDSELKIIEEMELIYPVIDKDSFYTHETDESVYIHFSINGNEYTFTLDKK